MSENKIEDILYFTTPINNFVLESLKVLEYKKYRIKVEGFTYIIESVVIDGDKIKCYLIKLDPKKLLEEKEEWRDVIKGIYAIAGVSNPIIRFKSDKVNDE